MKGIRVPLQVTGRKQLAMTATAAERIAVELVQFVGQGKGMNPFLQRDGAVMDSPVYSSQSPAAWSRIQSLIRRYFDLLASKRQARLVSMRVEHDQDGGRTEIAVEYLSLEDNRVETARWTP